VSEVLAAPTVPEDDPLARGRAALDRHAWAEGYELLVAADRIQPLSGPDLEQLALAAFFVPQPEHLGELKERAFKAHLDAGDEIRAAYVAIDLARFFVLSGRTSIASGWVRRAERLLPPDGETYAHGYLTLVRSEQAAAGGDLDGAMALAQRTIEIADRTGDVDLRAWGLSLLGEMKIASGATPDGIALLEEASIAAVNGELSPFTSGVTACRMIGACRDLTDYRRASEWIEATEQYCERRSLKGFPGVCRVHRAEVAAVGGHWAEAEQDLLATVGDLERYRATSPIADGYYALGEIRRLRGDRLRGDRGGLEPLGVDPSAAGSGRDPPRDRRRRGGAGRRRRGRRPVRLPIAGAGGGTAGRDGPGAPGRGRSDGRCPGAPSRGRDLAGRRCAVRGGSRTRGAGDGAADGR
jgi:hypothetical protein